MATAELDLRLGNEVVDQMALVRLDPKFFRFSVHWDPRAARTAEDWQKELGAAVVVNGPYFGHDNHPLTPLRAAGRRLGPETYQSDHGALVANERQVKILDLRGRDVDQAISPFPQAMVSYPLLIDSAGNNRAVETRHWLASRNFVAIDAQGFVIIGTTRTGFFTIYRLAEFLKSSPLQLRAALNLDGGPLVSQVVRSGDFSRSFHGTAEISDSADVLRPFWHAYCGIHWTLPIVFAATPNGRTDFNQP